MEKKNSYPSSQSKIQSSVSLGACQSCSAQLRLLSEYIYIFSDFHIYLLVMIVWYSADKLYQVTDMNQCQGVSGVTIVCITILNGLSHSVECCDFVLSYLSHSINWIPLCSYTQPSLQNTVSLAIHSLALEVKDGQWDTWNENIWTSDQILRIISLKMGIN